MLGYFGVSHNPRYSNVDYSNVRLWSLLYASTHGGPRFVISSDRLLLSLHTVWLRGEFHGYLTPTLRVLVKLALICQR